MLSQSYSRNLHNVPTVLHLKTGWLQVTLMSRDETSMLVVSYGDLKNCLDNVLKTQSSGPRAAPRLDMGRRL